MNNAESQLRDAVTRVTSGYKFSPSEMTSVVSLLMESDLDDVNLRLLSAAFMCSLKTRGETVDEIVGAANSLREHQVDVTIKSGTKLLLDTCGTGGDGAHLINISTITGIVTAALGIPVAKHGNRSVSSACGSADLLEAMGYPLLNNSEQVSSCVQDTGFGFFFAPHFHPALKNLASLRRSLGVRTMFNMLGPLVNPAGATHQLIGVFDRSIVSPIARAAARLGVAKCVVVHGEDGLDELSPNGVTWASLCQGEDFKEFEWTPESFGAKPVQLEALAGGDANENAKKCRDIIQGKSPKAASAIAMNAAVCLWLCDKVEDLRQGYQMSYEALDSGRVEDYFERCKQTAKKVAATPTD